MISTDNFESVKSTPFHTSHGTFKLMICTNVNSSNEKIKKIFALERLKLSIDKFANSLNDMYTCGVNSMCTPKINESMIGKCEKAVGRVTIALKEYEYKHKHTSETINIDSKIELHKFISDEYKRALDAIITTLKDEGFKFLSDGQVLLNGRSFVQEKEKYPRRDYNIFAIDHQKLI